MKILQIPEGDFPEPKRTVSPAPAADLGRVDALEDITKSILQRLHAIEERIDALEASPSPATASGMAKSSAPVDVNADAMNKPLFTKMWKYLNDKTAA